MSTSKRVANGLLWTVVYNIINAVYGFISVPMLIDHYGKEEYGIIGLALSINVYMQLMDLGFNSTNIRFFSIWFASGESQKLKRGFQSSLAFYGIVGLINGLILLIVMLFSGQLFDVTVEQNTVLQHLLLILIISAIVNWYSSCFDQLIKATENVGWVQRRSIIPKLLQMIILFLVICMDLSITLYFAMTSFAFFAILPMSVKKIRTEVKDISFIPKWDMQILREMLPYCFGIFAFGFFQFSFQNLRPVFLGIQGSLVDVTDYRILNGIIAIVSVFGSMFLAVLLPSTSRIVAQGDNNAYNRVAYEGTKYISIVVSFFCFGVMSVGPEFLTIYVGTSYLTLIPWLNIWLLCTLSTHNQAISSLVLAGSKVRSIAINSAIASFIGLVISWFLIPSLGLGAVIYAFVAYLAIQLGFYYFYYWPIKMNINSCKVFLYSFLPCVILGAVGYFIARWLPNNESVWIGFFIRGIVFVIVFIVGLSLIFNKSDVEFFKRMIKRAN